MQTARLSIYGRITSDNKKSDGFFEDILSENAVVDDLINGQNKEIVLHKVFELSDGNYQIGVVIKDIVSEIRGVKVIKFNISQFTNIPNDSKKND